MAWLNHKDKWPSAFFVFVCLCDMVVLCSLCLDTGLCRFMPHSIELASDCSCCISGVRVDLQRGEVTNSDICRRGYSAMTAVFILIALLPVIRALCVLTAPQGGPSSPTEQFVKWQQSTEQLACGPIVCMASRVALDVSTWQ